MAVLCDALHARCARVMNVLRMNDFAIHVFTTPIQTRGTTTLYVLFIAVFCTLILLIMLFLWKSGLLTMF